MRTAGARAPIKAKTTVAIAHEQISIVVWFASYYGSRRTNSNFEFHRLMAADNAIYRIVYYLINSIYTHKGTIPRLSEYKSVIINWMFSDRSPVGVTIWALSICFEWKWARVERVFTCRGISFFKNSCKTSNAHSAWKSPLCWCTWVPRIP